MQTIVVGRLTRSLRLSRSSDRAVHHAGGAASFLFLELIYTFIVAQASCLWGNRASRLVKLIVGRQDARRPHSQDGCATSCYPG